MFLLAAILTFACLCASAAFRSVVVERHDGTKLLVNIGDGLNAEVADGMLVLSGDKGRVAVPSDEIWRWSFSQADGDDSVWSGISDAVATGVVITRQGGAIVIRNLAEGERVSVAAVSGSVVLSAQAVNGEFAIPAETFPAGIYVVTYGSHAVKILLGR